MNDVEEDKIWRILDKVKAFYSGDELKTIMELLKNFNSDTFELAHTGDRLIIRVDDYIYFTKIDGELYAPIKSKKRKKQ